MSRKDEAIKLRLQGKSYGEILKILNIPSKGTLSYWFRNLKLSPSAKKRLAAKIAIAHDRGLFRYNRERTEGILRENEKMYQTSKRDVQRLSPRELLLIGASLYWGEGTKSERRKPSGITLANSDPKLIMLFLRFLRETLGVQEERIRAGILVHHNVDIDKAKQFWSGITKLPLDRFFITHQVSRASQFKRASMSLPFGTLNVKVNQRILFYKIKGYIYGIAEQAI